MKEALRLSEEILKSIEESDIYLSSIAIKALRLARLLDDLDYQKIFEYEINGYPSNEKTVPLEIWRLAVIAKRASIPLSRTP